MSLRNTAAILGERTQDEAGQSHDERSQRNSRRSGLGDGEESSWEHFNLRTIAVGRPGEYNDNANGVDQFRNLQRVWKPADTPFTPQENALVQTVAGALSGMPMTAGLAGLIPALEFLVLPSEHGPLSFSLGRLYIWALGISLTGHVFALLLKNHFIIREKLRFPTATATAALIGVLHDDDQVAKNIKDDQLSGAALSPLPETDMLAPIANVRLLALDEDGSWKRLRWKQNMRRLIVSFSSAGVFTIASYFIPALQRLPIFGTTAAKKWLWSLSLSPAFISYGMILDTGTVAYMVVGSIVGWEVLSPIAKHKGWAPGDVGDWENGSRGWTIWVSLGLILGDSVVGICWLIFQSLAAASRSPVTLNWFRQIVVLRSSGYKVVPHNDNTRHSLDTDHGSVPGDSDDDEIDTQDESLVDIPIASKEPLISSPAIALWFLGSLALCVSTTWFVYGAMVPSYAVVLAVVLVLPLSIVSLRALGETDVAPVESISKMCQFLFALIIPRSNMAGMLASMAITGIVEGGTCQSADLMPDLKTGYLVRVSPQAQFVSQIIGSVFGVFISSTAYRVFTSIYSVNDGTLQAPMAHLWIVTARLANGKGLPEQAFKFALVAATISATFAAVRIYARDRWWRKLIPGGVALAIGIYLIPAVTLTEAVGGAIKYYSYTQLQAEEFSIISIASGLILGEGVFSVLQLILHGLSVPHLD